MATGGMDARRKGVGFIHRCKRSPCRRVSHGRGSFGEMIGATECADSVEHAARLAGTTALTIRSHASVIE
jgi:hypothetical protein